MYAYVISFNSKFYAYDISFNSKFMVGKIQHFSF